MEPDIGEPPVADMLERSDDPVQERLGADEAVVGQQVGAIGEMLARAEADLEMQRARVAEQRLASVTGPSSGTLTAGSSRSSRASWPPRSLWPERRP